MSLSKPFRKRDDTRKTVVVAKVEPPKKLKTKKHELTRTTAKFIGEGEPLQWPHNGRQYFNGIYVSGTKTSYFELPYVDGVEIEKCAPGHPAYISETEPTYRLVALDDGFKKGDIIGYYAGEFRAINHLRGGNEYCLGITKGYGVDASSFGNEFAYINDPRESMDKPNLEKANVESVSNVFLANGTVRTLALVAKKDIGGGEELLWSYGTDFWKDYGSQIYSRVKATAPQEIEIPVHEEISLGTFVREYVRLDKNARTEKAAVRKMFQSLSPATFHQKFGHLSNKALKRMFGNAFISELKSQNPNFQGFPNAAAYKGISLVDEESKKREREVEQDETPAPLKKRVFQIDADKMTEVISGGQQQFPTFGFIPFPIPADAQSGGANPGIPIFNPWAFFNFGK